MKVIGITGGVGSGKSLVLAYLRKKQGVIVIEADKLAHDLQKQGNLCYDSIVREFGESILDETGEIDRAKLGSIVFSQEEKLLKLNAIVHPFVKKAIIHTIDTIQKEGSCQYIFIEAALLIEERYDLICDELWYIYVKAETRTERLMLSRGYTREKTEAIMKRQLEDAGFLKACQVVIDNNHDIEDTYRQIEEELAWRN